MSEEILKYNNILNKFSKIPIVENEQTFLDLCHYTGERFEEICSRILEFFFNPKKEHGFRDLWFKSLCDLFDESPYEYIDTYEMETRTEEPTSESEQSNKKRIDIILQTHTMIMAIENKIGAHLYNPLETYKEHIEKKYKKLQHKFLIVLTARKLFSDEKNKANDNGFVVVEYEQLFKKVKENLGDYVLRGKQKYLTFMLDFIKTVENRAYMMDKQPDLDKFFCSNKENIEKLVEQFNDWKDRIYQEQISAIKKVQESLNENETEYKWDTYYERLTKSFYAADTDKNMRRIGLEAIFKEKDCNPIGEFQIFITTWNNEHWNHYENFVLNKYPKDSSHILECKDKRRNYYMPVIELESYDDEKSYYDGIVEKIKEYGEFLLEIKDK